MLRGNNCSQTRTSVGEHEVLRLPSVLSNRLNAHLIVRTQLVTAGYLREFVAFIDQIAAVGLVTVKRPEDVASKNNMRHNGNIDDRLCFDRPQ
jgi:hypothetical protein